MKKLFLNFFLFLSLSFLLFACPIGSDLAPIVNDSGNNSGPSDADPGDLGLAYEQASILLCPFQPKTFVLTIPEVINHHGLAGNELNPEDHLKVYTGLYGSYSNPFDIYTPEDSYDISFNPEPQTQILFNFQADLGFLMEDGDQWIFYSNPKITFYNVEDVLEHYYDHEYPISPVVELYFNLDTMNFNGSILSLEYLDENPLGIFDLEDAFWNNKSLIGNVCNIEIANQNGEVLILSSEFVIFEVKPGILKNQPTP